MLNEVYLDLLINRVAAASPLKLEVVKDGKLVAEEKVSVVVKGLFKHIHAINCLPEHARFINGYSLEDVKIIDELKDFIMPECISMDPSSRMAVNFAMNGECHSNFKLNEFNDLQLQFRNFFKKTGLDGSTSISSLRTRVSLIDVLDKCPVIIDGEEYIHYEGTPFIPYDVKGELKTIGLYNKSYFNETYDNVIKDYISLMFI